MDALEFNVSTLLRADVGKKIEYDIHSDEQLSLDDAGASDIYGAVSLMRTNFGILVHARVHATVDLQCDRCLERARLPISTEFDEEYLPVVDVSTGLPVQSERVEETFQISPNHIVDLTEAMRQHLLLAVPMHVLCSKDCRGLCPTCGSNLNVAPCQCGQEEESHPFAALATLLSDGGPR